MTVTIKEYEKAATKGAKASGRVGNVLRGGYLMGKYFYYTGLMICKVGASDVADLKLYNDGGKE